MKKAPFLVWIISIFYLAVGLWYLPTLYNLLVVTSASLSTVSAVVNQSNGWVAIIGLLLSTLLSFVAAIYLFLLKRTAVPIFGALFVLGVVYIFTDHYQEIVHFSAVAISAALTVLLLRAILFAYVWHLQKKGILS